MQHKSILKQKRLITLLLAAVLLISTCLTGRLPASAKSDPIEPTGNVLFDEFIQLPEYTADASWGRNQRPLISKSGSTGCASYCADFVKYCYGLDTLTSQDKYTDMNEMRAGDIVHLQGPTYGHWIVILKRDGNRFYTAEGNWADVVRIGWKYEIVDGKLEGSQHDFDYGSHFLPEEDEAFGWQETSGGWQYDLGNGEMAKSEWIKDSGHWYYLDADGYMATGWQLVNGKWYHFGIDGIMQTGWKKIDGKWYYFGTNGAMVKGWRKIDNKWYYFSGGGAMVTGWRKFDDNWYYFSGGGTMVTGWRKLSGNWYYFSGGGVMQTGWKKFNGTWYYFREDGTMATGECFIGDTVYTFDQDGAWIEE